MDECHLCLTIALVFALREWSCKSKGCEGKDGENVLHDCGVCLVFQVEVCNELECCDRVDDDE